MEILYQSSDSILLSIFVNGKLTDADLDDVTVTIVRLLDDEVIVTDGVAARIGLGKYEYILSVDNNSVISQYRATWTYSISFSENIKVTYYDVVVGYTTAQATRDEFSELEDKGNDDIYRKEKLARRIINSVTGQIFDFESVTKIIRGRDSNTLYLPRRVFDLVSVKIDGTDDITSEIELFDERWLRQKVSGIPGTFLDIKRGITEPANYFTSGVDYHILAGWGWESVPEDIQEATRLLINDYFNDDVLLRQHGVISTQMGDRTITLRPDFWGTTGNYDVDILLANYIDMKMRLI